MNTAYKFAAVAAALLALASCSSSEKDSAKAEVEELPIVTVDVAHRMEVPQKKVYLIKKITVDVGDRVRAGEALVELDRANIDQLRINLEQLEREYNRAVKLFEIGGGTQQSVDQLKAQLDASRTQYDNMLENTVLVSPINGVVTARNYDPGDMTGSAPVLSLGQLSPVVKVIINISENDLALVKQGMPVEITFDAFPAESFSGRIQRVYPTVDPATRTFSVEVQIANPGERIKPGMFARVSIDLGAQQNVVVPDRAVVKQSGSGNKYVYVLSDGRVSYRKVTLGQRFDTTYELLDGIEDGDTVVITGQTRLADGVAVEVH